MSVLEFVTEPLEHLTAGAGALFNDAYERCEKADKATVWAVGSVALALAVPRAAKIVGAIAKRPGGLVDAERRLADATISSKSSNWKNLDNSEKLESFDSLNSADLNKRTALLRAGFIDPDRVVSATAAQRMFLAPKLLADSFQWTEDPLLQRLMLGGVSHVDDAKTAGEAMYSAITNGVLSNARAIEPLSELAPKGLQERAEQVSSIPAFDLVMQGIASKPAVLETLVDVAVKASAESADGFDMLNWDYCFMRPLLERLNDKEPLVVDMLSKAAVPRHPVTELPGMPQISVDRTRLLRVEPTGGPVDVFQENSKPPESYTGRWFTNDLDHVAYYLAIRPHPVAYYTDVPHDVAGRASALLEPKAREFSRSALREFLLPQEYTLRMQPVSQSALRHLRALSTASDSLLSVHSRRLVAVI